MSLFRSSSALPHNTITIILPHLIPFYPFCHSLLFPILSQERGKEKGAGDKTIQRLIPLKHILLPFPHFLSFFLFFFPFAVAFFIRYTIQCNVQYGKMGCSRRHIPAFYMHLTLLILLLLLKSFCLLACLLPCFLACLTCLSTSFRCLSVYTTIHIYTYIHTHIDELGN